MHHPRQPDRLVGELDSLQLGTDAAGVSLVEDQVEDAQDGPQTRRLLLWRRHPERLTGGPDSPLCPADPLSHGRLVHEERVRDLGRGQPADRAERERDR